MQKEQTTHIYPQNRKKVSDETLILSYSKTGNVWKTAEEVGMCGQSVYERLSRLGVVKKMNKWTEADNEVLREKYIHYKFENRLNDLALELGRTRQFICRKAHALGLTDRSKKVVSNKTRLKISVATKQWIKEKGHPRGMLGRKHSKETLKELSEHSIRLWKENSYLNSDANKQRLSDNLHYRKMRGDINVFSIRGDHEADIGGKTYIFKSSWEKQIAKLLQGLVEKQEIKCWGYETKHFEFHDIKRGNRSYCPDFEITLVDGSLLYIEVKGWKMKKSMERIKMFRERYPDEKFYLIDKAEYGKILSESDYLRRRCV